MVIQRLEGGVSLTPTPALQRTRALAELQEAQDALSRMSFLASASEQLAGSLDLTTTLDCAARLAVSSLADWCILEIAPLTPPAPSATERPPLAAGAKSRIAVAHADTVDPLQARQLQSLLSTGSLHLRIADQAREGGTTTFNQSGPSMPWVTGQIGNEDPGVVAALQIDAAVATPLMARDRQVGVITLIRCLRGSEYGPGDVALAKDFAHRVALAVANAQSHEGVLGDVRAREEFLSAFTHDLKNPLTCVKVYAQLVRRQITGGLQLDIPHMVLRLDRLVDVTERLTSSIEDAQAAARARCSRLQDLKRRPTDLVAMVREMVQDYTLAHERMQFDVEATVPQLTGEWDPIRLERVIQNLLGNAAKYGGEHVIVSVDATVKEGAMWAVLAVRDHGVGVPAYDLPHVFDHYHRASNVIGRIDGSGVGLAAAKQIVEQHGGRIEVESEEGAGSTFTVYLPLPQRSLDTSADAVPHGSAYPQRGRAASGLAVA
jgi:signal transduction histidine kinase